jgi:glucose/arabinose dehydrogenase
MRWKSVVLAALIVGACSGGGSNPPPPPANSAPVITSAATASAAENTTAAVYQATATDADGNSISFRIEGPDAGRFTINGGGAISFSSAPNFEAPADADANNVYQIILVASDGSLEARRDVAITVTNVPDQLSARQIGGFGNAVAVAAIPGSSDIFVAEAGGRIYRTNPSGAGPGTLYLTVSNLSDVPPSSGDTGLLNVVAAPDFATSGTLYVFVINGARDLEVRRYGRLASGLGNPAADTVLRIPHPNEPFYNFTQSAGGGLAFGPDGFLYVGVGQARILGSPPDTSSQDLNLLLGKILRLDVLRDDFPADPDRDYGIPAGNPIGNGAREIFAYGVENPRRMSFDGSNLLIGDAHFRPGGNVGFELQEILLLRPQDAGANFGTPAVSGPGITPAVVTVRGTNSSASGRITGGYVYRGPVPQLNGLYIFAETVTRQVLAVPAASIVQGQTITSVTSLNELLPPEAGLEINSFGLDANNNLYLLPGGGVIYILELR